MGIGERTTLWSANFEFLKSRPFFGIGFGRTGDHAALYLKAMHPEKKDFFVGHAHNVFLEMLSSVGVIGFIAWMVWVLARMRESYRLTFPSPGVFCAWIVFLINGLTQVNFWEGKVLHMVIWMSALGLSLTVKKGYAHR
jgi:O-antigen ligase